ncbi:hypothetical protein [Rhodococcus erythropolis]|uniref:hypothetical protein n=1 Tax=Rhodococcus erythropolis TaxID=1833 RepID=UPI00367284CB
MRQPTVGAIVHYQPHDGWNGPEGPIAAMVTAVRPDGVNLTSFAPGAQPGYLCNGPGPDAIAAVIPFAANPAPGHWNWPPIVDVDSEIQALVELGENRPCRRCDGCGRVANSEDAEPWTMWEALPPGSDLAVQMGVVRPVTCLDCNGSGTVDL